MEVERNPEPPILNQEVIQLLTALIFRNDDDLEKVDAIFVYSSITGINKLVKLIDKLLLKDISKNIFITGGITPKEVVRDLSIELEQTEADTLLNALSLEKYSNLNVFVERNSTNTLENVTETLKFPEFKASKSILFIFKSHAAGRGYLTLRKFFPKSKILQNSFNAKYKKARQEITRENWYTFEFGRRRIWGEYLRIKRYGSRGDIEYEEVKTLVEQIEESL